MPQALAGATSRRGGEIVYQTRRLRSTQSSSPSTKPKLSNALGLDYTRVRCIQSSFLHLPPPSNMMTVNITLEPLRMTPAPAGD
jgi:hypothetical protein